MPGRPPLQVEVVTKIPVRTGLGLADPGVTGGISRAVTGVQSAAGRAAVEVVTDVPGQLRNITPITLGQRAAQIGKISVNVGSKVLGVGLGVIGNLAQDLLFPDPVGLGSDMVGGVKIGSRPKSASITNPQPIATNSQPIAKPQVTATPFKPPAPVVAPVAAPQTRSQTQVQTQPLPAPTTTRPQSAPVQPKPEPISIAIPSPRSALDTLLPSRSKPISTKSPFPLDIVDLTTYGGGVNLTYPIAQKLIELSSVVEQNQIDLKKLPQEFEDILKNARIQTQVNLPAKIDLTSQIPIKLDLSKQVPVSSNMVSQLPFKIDLSKQVPVAVDLKKQIPITADLSSKLPLAVDFKSQIPLQLDLSKKMPITADMAARIPVTVDLAKSVPVNVDLSKKVPLTLDLSALLQPDTKASGLDELQECCESIQSSLKKKAEMFEGRGELICGEGTTPFSYRGEGLNGIHQLIKIVLGANQQILEKICNLNIEYPLIEGSGTYHCGTLPPTPYHYSGVGFLGIQNQVNQLFNLEKKILSEVCEIGSTPEISGKIEYFDCDAQTQTILYSGNGFEGLSNQVNALSSLVKVNLKATCDTSAIVLMPDMRSEQFKVTRQLVITWGTQYPSQKGSLWHSYIPNPIEGLNWCKDFENLSYTKGSIFGRLFWESSKMHTGIYCSTEEEARRIITQLAAFSNATPEYDDTGSLNPRIAKGGKLKRKPAIRTLRAVRAAIVEIGADGEAESVVCFVPPPEGCLPVII